MPQNVISNTVQVILYKLFFVPDGKRFCRLLESGQEPFARPELSVHNIFVPEQRPVEDILLGELYILFSDLLFAAQ